MKGFGTVVTGTLVAGELAMGEEVEALPSGRRARVRGLQVHGETVERAAAGTRTAVNLAGEVEGLARGEVLARPGTLRATSMIDAEVSLLPGARPLADGARVRVHAASAEVLARVRLLGAESARARAEARSPSCGSRAPPSPGAGTVSCCAPTRPPTRSPAPSSWTRCRRGGAPPTARRSSGCATPWACSVRRRRWWPRPPPPGSTRRCSRRASRVPLARAGGGDPGERLRGRSRAGPRGGRLARGPRAAGRGGARALSRSSTGRTR